MAAQWHEVVSCGGRYQDTYRVSTAGDVRSLDRERPGRARRDGTISIRKVKGTVLSPRIRKNGLRCVNLWTANTYDQVPVRVIVLEAFKGPCPDGYQPVNKNGDLADNRLSNLAWKPGGGLTGLAALRRRMSRR